MFAFPLSAIGTMFSSLPPRVRVLVFVSAFVLGIVGGIALFITYKHFYHEPVKPISYIKQEYVRCIGLGSDKVIGECLNQLAQYSYDSYPIKDVGTEFDQLTYQQKNRWCHESMHYLGWRAYQKEGSVAKAFMKALPICDSGMYHGVMEEYLRENGLSDNIPELINGVCTKALADNPDFSEGTKALCYHGLGHGLMYITVSDLKKSLDFCDMLQTPSESSECYSGVFMEYKTSKAIGALDNDKNLDDFSQCLNLTLHQKDSCFLTQGLNYLSLAQGHVKEAMQYCSKVPAEYMHQCYLGVGANSPSPGRSHHDSALACEPAREISVDAYQACIEGSLGFVAQLDRGDPAGSIEFCEAIDDDQKTLCYRSMGQTLQGWVDKGTDPLAKCAMVKNEMYRQECIAGVE